ncbi:hypothetical protein HNY73_019653 [Argiope bruennichi]|uniref:Uncharacterized protein n=2 Tax=Araneidae TaxID=6913 RepID=A0A8T0E5Q5_ARGBR|nr:hypothetical protein HNY73_019653 [Argiope bruennichi]
MMDLIACGAPLDNSFQKNKLELVNKGSLGRRRRPSRSNLKLLLSSSYSAPESPNSTPQTPNSAPQTPNSTARTPDSTPRTPNSVARTPDSTPRTPNSALRTPTLILQTSYSAPRTPSPAPRSSTPTPTACSKKPLVNGSVHKERSSPQNFKPLPRIESSLPRTSSESKLVADAQQFSIEAKLKRKKSDVGRSAVLIQTWERRTRNDSLPKRQQSLKNRFQNKENIGELDAMPDSYICAKYSGNTLSVESLKNGGLASKVRAAYSDETMLYRMSENGQRYDKQVQVNGNELNGEEPEWISLSRKLRAKFVEGHIEHNSADSYLHEEPDGVKQHVVKLIPPPQPTKQAACEAPQKCDIKKKVVDSMDVTAHQTDEPPWIHLSRKLCTKFIEEHIEYPLITPDHSVKEINTIEPNGDVRIIEKIGKPKCRNSKTRKESEPEWVSLSRKLRAKFIESHIDDPETISLDNQLNASDPEETSSESLSDTSQEMVVPKKTYKETKESVCQGFDSEKKAFQDIPSPYENNYQTEKNKVNSTVDDDCSWEYQEIEFEPEDSGTFQEQDSFEDPFLRPTKHGHENSVEIKVQPNAHYDINKQESRQNNSSHFTSFAETVNAHMFSNAECYNNDVIFSSGFTGSEKSPPGNLNNNKKVITVQFVSRREKEPQHFVKVQKSAQTQVEEPLEKSHNSSFFNLTTWEEAHYKSDDDRPERICSPSSNISLIKEWRSLEDICDHKKRNLLEETKNKSERERRYSEYQNAPFPMKENHIYNSVDVLDKTEYQNGINHPKSNENHFKSQNSSEVNNKRDNNTQQTKITANQFSVNGITGKDVKYENSDNFTKRENNTYSNGNICESSEHPTERYVNDNNVSSHACESANDSEISKREEKEEFSNSDSSGSNKSKQEKSDNQRNSYSNKKNPVCEDNNFNGNTIHENGASLEYDSFEFLDKDYAGYESHESDLSSDSELNRSRKKNLKNYKESENRHINQSCEKKSNMSDDTKQFQIEENGKASKNNSHSKDKNDNNNKASNKKSYKCNGVIPNSKEVSSNKYSNSHEHRKEEKISNNSYSDLQKSEKRISKVENNNSVNEYANINPVHVSSQAQRNGTQNSLEINTKCKSAQSVSLSDIEDESPDDKKKSSRQRRNTFDTLHNELAISSPSLNSSEMKQNNRNTNKLSPDNTNVKTKSKSCQDISRTEHISAYQEESKREMKSNGTGPQNNFKSHNASTIQFQEFESEADIPLCAKLVSKQNGKRFTPSISSSSNRNPSPCSESSHVYEDMFKETTSCPSDSETSSWTVMKPSNSYYVNGRSSSMNDLDYSDSCSMSVKCDYASSSEQSTLQSRQSSVNSSSFYVNLRDYDSHMLEPSLSRKRKDNKKATKNGNLGKFPNSNPPTPESLRHLFTSPLNSIHSPPNRASRLINKLPQEPESHYYSTAAAASSAFKHGFDPTPPKPKKTERSSSIKIKDIAHGIILTFKRFQNHSKTSHVSPTHYVDVSHLADPGTKANGSESSKSKSKKEQKEIARRLEEKRRWAFSSENLRTDSDSGCQLTTSDAQRQKARRSSSDLVGKKPGVDVVSPDVTRNGGAGEKKKTKNGKKSSNAKEKGKKSRSKSLEPRTVPTVTRKVQQMADGTLYLVTTVSGDTALPGVYSDSPDTSSELSSHRPVKLTGESNC